MVLSLKLTGDKTEVNDKSEVSSVFSFHPTAPIYHLYFYKCVLNTCHAFRRGDSFSPLRKKSETKSNPAHVPHVIPPKSEQSDTRGTVSIFAFAQTKPTPVFVSINLRTVDLNLQVRDSLCCGGLLPPTQDAMGDEGPKGTGVRDGDITHTQATPQAPPGEDVGQITMILFVFTRQGECG